MKTYFVHVEVTFTTQYSVLEQKALLGTDRTRPHLPGAGAGGGAGERCEHSEGRSGPGAHKGRRPRLLGVTG